MMVNLQQEKLRIVILDAQGVNPGDLSWDCFASLGELCIYPFSEDAQVAERIGNAQIALTNKSRITREVMEACPELRYIGVLATGYNAVDIEQAHQRGICVTNIPAYSTMAVAQHTFALARPSIGANRKQYPERIAKTAAAILFFDRKTEPNS